MFTFRYKGSFYGKELLKPRPTPKLEDHPLSVSATAYLIYSQLLSVLEAVPLHNEERNDLYASPNMVRVIKSGIRWAEHVARMVGREAYTGFWWGNLRERGRLGDPGVYGRIILRWIFMK